MSVRAGAWSTRRNDIDPCSNAFVVVNVPERRAGRVHTCRFRDLFNEFLDESQELTEASAFKTCAGDLRREADCRHLDARPAEEVAVGKVTTSLGRDRSPCCGRGRRSISPAGAASRGPDSGRGARTAG
jgi:hypothetical protein